ncbi:MAG: response regulator, partial [Polyangiaceae bacterium]
IFLRAAGSAVASVLLVAVVQRWPARSGLVTHATLAVSVVCAASVSTVAGYTHSPAVWFIPLAPLFAGYVLGARESFAWGALSAAAVGLLELLRRANPNSTEYSVPEDELWLRVLLMVGVVLFLAVAIVRAHSEKVAALEQREATIRELLADLSHKNDEATRARDEAIAASRAKGEFLAIMSHEIRTPLNAVLGLTGVLLDAPIQPEQREIVRTIRASGDSLLLLLNDILDFSKIEAGRLQLENAPFDVVDCAEDALDLFSAVASDKGLDLSCEATPDVPERAFGDAGRVRQILVNLVSNAIKFTLRGTVQILIDAEPATLPGGDVDTRFHFAVRDTGIGIPQDHLSALFQPFSQVDASTTRRFGGTGLGLAICRTLAERMGGRVWAESKKGHGSTFHFTILARSMPELPTSDSLQQSEPAAVIVTPREGTRSAVASQLAAMGFTVTGVARVSELTETLASTKPDLILVDESISALKMREATARLHRQPALILLSTAGRDTAARRALREQWGPDPLILAIPVRRGAMREAIDHALGFDNTPLPRSSGVQVLSTELPLRILVAEDNPVNQRVALLLLERLGYRADVVANGAEAALAVHQRTYDVVLMDVRMPEVDGIEATKRIRAELPADQQPRIVALTANAMAEDRSACEAAGMDDFLSKPITAKELERALRGAKPSDSKDFLSEGALGTKELDALRRLTSGTPGLLQQIIDEYIETADRLVTTVREATDRGSLQDIERAAHSLKGSSGQMGAHPLMLESAAIERAAASGDLPGIRDRLPMLVRKHEATREKLSLL